MKKLNKKGFTLIELLAVIVVLAIIMVIAATQVGKAIETARNGAFISSYKMVVKEIKNKILENDISAASETIACTASDCNSLYDLSDDYVLTVNVAGTGRTGYDVVLRPAANKRFSNIAIECPVDECLSLDGSKADVIAVNIDSEAKVTAIDKDAAGTVTEETIKDTTTKKAQ